MLMLSWKTSWSINVSDSEIVEAETSWGIIESSEMKKIANQLPREIFKKMELEFQREQGSKNWGDHKERAHYLKLEELKEDEGRSIMEMSY